MARIVETVEIARSPSDVWAAVGDIGGLATSVPQLVASCEYDQAAKILTVTFGNGMSLIEPIIAHDDDAMLVAWTARGGNWDHHNASMQVHASDGDGCQVQWIADVLPDSAEGTIQTIVQAGLGALKETLESKV